MIDRLLELFEGPEAPASWAPPPVPAALHRLFPWRAWDEQSELYVNASSIGFVLEIPPFVDIDEEVAGALAGTFADAAPERCTLQVLHWASPRFGATYDAWAAPRVRAGGDSMSARLRKRRTSLRNLPSSPRSKGEIVRLVSPIGDARCLRHGWSFDVPLAHTSRPDAAQFQRAHL